MNLSAYADDVAQYMRDYSDAQAAGEVIFAFSPSSKLYPNPTVARP